MEELTCPHCHEPIEVYEGQDLDKKHLTPNVRGPLERSGVLKAWAKLKKDKNGRSTHFLYLKDEVDTYEERKVLEDLAKVLSKTGQMPADADLDDPEIVEKLRQVRSIIFKVSNEDDGDEPQPARRPRTRK